MSDNLFEDHNEDDKDFYAELVGEGKKYKDPQALAKAKHEADRFIEKLKSEAAEARAELKTRITMEELADKVSRPRTPEAQPTTPRQEPGKQEDQEDISEKVRALLKEEKDKESRSNNFKKSRELLEGLYGSDYKAALTKAARELEVSEDYLNNMAASTPNGFAKLVSSVVAPDDNRPSTPPSSTVNPTTHNKEVGTRNQAYYRQLRKTDPKAYFSKAVQQEMHKEATRQGDAFYN